MWAAQQLQGLDSLWQREPVRDSGLALWNTRRRTGVAGRYGSWRSADSAYLSEDHGSSGAFDAGLSYTVSKNLILEHRSDLFTAVQTPEVCPLTFFHEVRQQQRESACKTKDGSVHTVFGSSWPRRSSGLLFNKLQSMALKTSLFPGCWSWQSYFLIKLLAGRKAGKLDVIKFLSHRLIHKRFVLRQPFSFRADSSGAAVGLNTKWLPQEDKGGIKSFH